MKKLEKYELEEFINNLNKINVNEEIRNIERLKKYDNALFGDADVPLTKAYPYYLKGIRDAMLALGYTEGWVNDTFRKILENNMLPYRKD